MTPLSQMPPNFSLSRRWHGWWATTSFYPYLLARPGLAKQISGTRTKDPEFLGSVLDFLLMDDAWLSEFCQSANYGYDFPMRARAALPGGDEVSWT